MQYPWIQNAQACMGIREIKGAQHNPKILEMWKKIKRGGIKDDETPWCSAFVGACFEDAGIQSTRFEGARSWLSWGEAIAQPRYGCVVVFDRPGGAHVGFVVGVDRIGNLQVLGGNQSDAVNIMSFPRSRATGYRWPTGIAAQDVKMPVYDKGMPISTKES